MSIEANKALVRKIWNTVFNERNLEPVDSLLAPEYTFQGQPQTPAQLKGWIQELFKEWPDIYFTILDLLGDADQVAIRHELNATDPENGERMHTVATNVITIADGKFVSNWQTGGEKMMPDVPGSGGGNG